MNVYGLYLYRSSQPLFTGTKHECRGQVNNLSDAERMHGWTIKPFHPDKPLTPGQKVSRVLWASVGFGILFTVAAMSFLALRGHLQ